MDGKFAVRLTNFNYIVPSNLNLIKNRNVYIIYFL